MDKKMTIRGQIIRIVDMRTVLINLGYQDGIANSSIFRIVGQSELILDPKTKLNLGSIDVVKARVKASQVYERFTVATSKWIAESVTMKTFEDLFPFSSLYETKTEAIGSDLRVDEAEVEPWKAHSEQPIRVGDEVVVEITIDEENPEALSPPDPSEREES